MADENAQESAVHEPGHKREIKYTEKAIEDKLHRHINVRRHKLGQLTTKTQEIDNLMEDDYNLEQIEQMHLKGLQKLLEEFIESNDTVLHFLKEEEQNADQEYWFQPKLDRFSRFAKRIEEAKLRIMTAQKCAEDVSHLDSVSMVSASRHRTGKPVSGTGSVNVHSSVSLTSSIRLKEEANRAALMAKAAAMEKRQALELQKAQLQAKMESLDMEAAIAESTAKIKVYEEFEAPQQRDGMNAYAKSLTQHEKDGSYVAPKPMDRKRDSLPQLSLSHDFSETRFGISRGQQPRQNSTEDAQCHNDNMGSLFKVMQKQNDITEMLAKQQQISHLPQVDIPVFHGDPLQYRSFMRAFEHAIESKTESAADKLYYLEQYTRGEPRDLIRSCQHMTSNRGFKEAMKLLQNHYGNELKIATAYMEKAFQWPQIKAEDAKSLNSFSLFLVSCRNAMEDIDYMDEMDNPANMRTIISKLPYKIRERWRSSAFDIHEKYQRRAKFSDLVIFIDRQARVTMDPLFGNISDAAAADKKEKNKATGKSTNKYEAKRSSFATNVISTDEPALHTFKTKREATSYNVALSKPCLFCEKNHTLEVCTSIRDKLHKDKIEFLRKSGLCFGCLVKGHLSKECKKKMICQVCSQKHPSLLHIFKPERTFNEKTDGGETEQTISSALVSLQKETSAYTGAGGGDCILAIVPVRVKSKKSPKTVETYAFMDPGSSGTFCTEELARQLNLSGRKTEILLQTMNLKENVDSYMLSDMEVSSLEDNNFIDLPKVFTQKEIPVSKQNIPLQKDVNKWPYLTEVKLPYINAEVGLLIGTNAHKAMEPWRVINSQDNGPYAVRTALGWVVNGPLKEHNDANSENAERQWITTNRISLQSIEELTIRQYNHDFPERNCDDKMEMSLEDRQFMDKVKNSVHNIDGHYYINLPVKKQTLNMPNNRSLALQRALGLKKKLAKNPGFHEEYTSFINNLVEKGYAVQAEHSHQDGRVWYIPHHGVYHPQKKKLRVVFDCAASFQGTSLNNILLQGPDLTNSLVGVLTRFRQERVAVMADVEAMYHQVRVPDEDTNLLRFLWWPQGNLTENLAEYKMTVHIFGATSSPSCATFALRKTAEDNISNSSPETVDTVFRNFYVDDCLKSVPSEDEAVVLVQDLTALCATGGFHLTKWASNSRLLLSSIPEEERAKDFKNLDLSQDILPVERALGVQWCTEDDSFRFTINTKDRPVSRRGILSVVSSIYDPLGFLAPLTLPVKMLLQQMCKDKRGWDEDIPEVFAQKWLKWLNDLHQLSDFSVRRSIKPANFGPNTTAQLHHFSDASEHGYGTVSYIRLVNGEGQSHCAFLMGKARVAPLKQTTIPRMELTAAVVAVKTDKRMKKELQLDLLDSVFWTDSTTVLRYIASETCRFKTFVANRIADIRENTRPAQWRYVNTSLNPADCASRGQTAENFLMNHTWIYGPSYFQTPEEQWPERPDLQQVKQDDVELRKSLIVNVNLTHTMEDPVSRLIQHYSKWYQLKKAVAWMLKLKETLLQLSKKRQELRNAISQTATISKLQKDAMEQSMCDYKRTLGWKSLTVKDLADAEREIIHFSQRQTFHEEMSALQQGASVKRSSPTYRLDPILQDRILRVGGRLCNSAMPEEAMHPVFLSKDMHIATLILQDIHERIGHSGRNYMLSQLRQRYWIPKANSAIRKLLLKCVVCSRQRGKTGEQKMSSLPPDRVLPDQPPFTNVGVDYFGPIEVRRGRSTVKRYGVLFTCLTVRAVHIEVAHSLDTDSCINALRRFVCRRGQVKIIRSDNGTNFVGAERELREAIQQWNQSKIQDSLMQRGIQWIFNPPYGSHHGGVWERQIRTVRKVLNSVLKQQTLDDECLQTVLCEAEAIINNRPITTSSEDPSDLEPLTPNHLLLMKKQPLLPVRLSQKADIYARRRWRQTQYIADLFWKRWAREYLPLLQERQKWSQVRRNLSPNDVVLVVDETAPRNSWVMGRVLKTIPDKKGLVRRVLIKTKTNILERPITKLCLLCEADS